MTTRRQFCKAVGACALAANMSNAAMASGSNGRHFDLNVALRILKGESELLQTDSDGDRSLWLCEFATYDHEAVATLVGGIGKLWSANIGFQTLTPGTANVLSALNVFCFSMDSLSNLDLPTAEALKWPAEISPVRGFDLLTPISAGVAATLVANAESCPLDLALPSIDVPVAECLARHNGGLYLHVKARELDISAVVALSSYAGLNMTLKLDGDLDDDVIEALSSNSAKQVSQSVKARNIAYLESSVFADHSSGDGPRHVYYHGTVSDVLG